MSLEAVSMLVLTALILSAVLTAVVMAVTRTRRRSPVYVNTPVICKYEYNGVPVLDEGPEDLVPLGPPEPDECPECLTVCHICDGNGRHRCQGYGCGGRGYIEVGVEPCPDCITLDKANPKCRICGGTKQVPVHGECPICHGTKLQKCGNCHGRGQYSSSFLNGAAWPSPEDPMPPRCPACMARQERRERQALRELTGKYVTQSPAPRK